MQTKRTLIETHCGAGSVAPRSTMTAFWAARRANARAIETGRLEASL